MSIYCVSDLHGRYDLFKAILEKINFNPKNDILYLLGDAIDHSYGGIKIIHYMMKYKKSCIFIRGNHEEHFLSCISMYDFIMSDIKLREAIVEIGKYSSIFNQIFKMYTHSASLNDFVSSKELSEWSNQGNVKRRKAFLVLLSILVKNTDTPRDIMAFIWQMNNSYKTREFINELIQLSNEEYNEIKSYLNNTSKSASLKLNGRCFELMHYMPIQYIYDNQKASNTYYVYGHNPVPKIHREMNDVEPSFYFDYRKILSFKDINNNYYYNLDLGSNPVSALRLDDLSEYYVGSQNDAEFSLKIPGDTIECKETYYEKYNLPIMFGKTFFKRCTQNRFVIVTYEGNSYEYLIAIDKTRKKIYYYRIAWLALRNGGIYFVIDGIDVKQMTIDEIIEIVRVSEKNDREYIENFLNGFSFK